MPAATILIPTHAHAGPLRVAVSSALRQTLADFELFIVGDGVGDDTRAVVAELSGTDRRIRFFDFPKAPRKGEVLRNHALQEARGRIVAYLGDDDFWLPHHLETLDRLLTSFDFGHTLHVGVDRGGRLFARAADLASPAFRTKMLTTLFNGFDMACAGHTLEAYRRLPRGWETTPDDFPWIDLYLWRKFLEAPWCRSASTMVPTAICTQSHKRPTMTDDERTAELEDFVQRFARPAGRERLWRIVARSLARQIVKANEAIDGSRPPEAIGPPAIRVESAVEATK